MRVIYLGPISTDRLSERINFDNLPRIRRQYAFGSELVLGFIKAGYHVSIVVGSVDVAELHVAHGDKCDVWVFPERKYRYQYPTLYSREVRIMRSCIEKINPDVCIANWTYQYARAAVTSRPPAIVIARDSAWRCLFWMRTWTMLFRSFYSQLLVFPRVKHLVTISPHMVDELRRFNFYSGDITVIPNGINRELGDVCIKKIKREAKTILCVSEWNKLKNTTSLMSAFSLLRKTHPDWRLIMVGNCMDRNGAALWAERHLDSSENIMFMGLQPQSEIRRLMSDEADVFCSPTLEESLGMVFLEAMSWGCPCVGGDKSGAVPWVLDNGKAGVLTDVKSPAVLARDIEMLMLDYARRKELSASAFMRIKNSFMLDNLMGLYADKIREVANAKD